MPNPVNAALRGLFEVDHHRTERKSPIENARLFLTKLSIEQIEGDTKKKELAFQALVWIADNTPSDEPKIVSSAIDKLNHIVGRLLDGEDFEIVSSLVREGKTLLEVCAKFERRTLV